MTTFMDRWLCTRYSDLGSRAEPFDTITKTLERLDRPVTIVETGCLRQEGNWAGDGQSTVVWDQFVSYVGGFVFSVDLDPVAVDLANSLTSVRTKVDVDDSVDWLSGLADGGASADLLYLDSYDIDWSNPEPSMEHHLSELAAAMPILSPGSVVAVDDNREDVGKGYLVGVEATRLGWEPLTSGYVRAWIVN